MNINRLQNDQGEFRCFEIDNTIISRSGMAKVVAQLANAKITHAPRFYDDEEFCEFELNGHKFKISEPYGDSTTYDVVAPSSPLPEMELVAAHFETATPIKGGDFGQRLFFMFHFILGAAIWISIGSAAVWGYNRVFS
jgi:hypothetical protein